MQNAAHTNLPAMTLWERARVIHRAWRFRLRTERAEVRFMLRHLRPGQTTLDIGSHKGAYAYWMCKRVGRLGRVIAFEPLAELAAYLVRIKEAFRFEQMQVVAAALSSQAGTAELFQPESNPRGGATLEAPRGQGSTIRVPVVTLDDQLQQLGCRPVHFIKCDVEGHELEVLQGGRQMLEADRPILLLECQEFRHPEGQTARVFSFLRSLGYEGFFFPGGRLTPVDQFTPSVHQPKGGKPFLDNFAFLPQ